MQNNERGFTIIELLLVILVAVLFTSGCLSISRSGEQRKLYMTARDIQTLIRQSQDKAYAEQAAYEVSFFTVDDTCVQIRNNKILKRIIIPRGITIGAVNFPRNELYFTRKLTPSGGGTIWLYSKSHKINITVLPVTGRVKIYPVTKK